MDYWCGGEDFGVDSSVPTTCATLTILIVMPSVLMSLISIAQIWFYRSQLQDQSDVIRGWNQSLCVYAAFCLAEVLFSVVFSMDDKKTPALLVGIASHCIAWTLLAAKAVHAVAATRHRLVVDLTSWGFYVVDFIGIGLLALGQFAEARTPLNLAAAVCNFLLGLAVLMFCFYIQYLNSRQTYRALKGGSGGGNDCIRNCYEYFLIRLFSERRSQRYSFETATEEGRRSFWSIHSDTKSWWGDSINDDGAERAWPSVNQPLLIDDATREGLMFAAGGHNSVVVESAVLSALERRLAKPQFAFDNGNNAGYLDGQAVIQDDAMVMTDVLRNALERRKRKDRSGGGTDIFSDDFSLTAGGSSSSAGGNMQEFSVIIHRWALLRERSSISADLCDSSVNPLILSPAGFIDTDASLGSDAVIDLESGGSVHDPNQRQYTRKKNRGRSFSGNSINPDDSSGQVPGSSADAAQVEFEICIRCGPCAEMEWWGRSKGVHPTLNKWTVWKTALQIEEFHRSMVGHGSLSIIMSKLNIILVNLYSSLCMVITRPDDRRCIHPAF